MPRPPADATPRPMQRLRELVRAQRGARDPDGHAREARLLAARGRHVHAIEIARQLGPEAPPGLERELRRARIDARTRRGEAPLRADEAELVIPVAGNENTTWALTLGHALAEAPAGVRSHVLRDRPEPLVLHWVGARHRGDSETAADLPLLLSILRRDVDLWMIGPEIPPGVGERTLRAPGGRHRVRLTGIHGRYTPDVAAALPTPDLAAMFCAGLDMELDSWTPSVHELVRRDALTVVTGYSGDQSLVQDEDILAALGATIVTPTELNPGGWNRRPGEILVKNYAAVSFRGGQPSRGSPADALRERGFDIPE